MDADEQSLYELLGVSDMADSREIGLAFRCAAKRWHPDVNASDAEEATERMKRISAAYEVLRDPDRRAAYNRSVQLDLDGRTTTSNVDQCNASSSEDWWMSAPGSPFATISPDPGAPPGFFAPRARFPLGATFVLRARRHIVHAVSKSRECGGRQRTPVAVLWLAACPFLFFLLAAWFGRRWDFALWGALYTLGPLVYAIGAAIASPLIVLAGPGLMLLGAVHCLRWRHRLHAAIVRENSESLR
jgi:hypothetical protein